VDYNDDPGMTDTRLKLWRRLDQPGHELSSLAIGGDGAATLRGTAVFAEGGVPTLVSYEVACGDGWRTRTARASGSLGTEAFDVILAVDATGKWTMNGTRVPAVDGCIDVDLSFTPATNLLPIRRLALPVGASAPVRAAWLRFPELTVEVLEQTYHRSSPKRYAYESDGGAFRAELEVDDAGMVVHYENLWKAE
jgi:hypothetical protein